MITRRLLVVALLALALVPTLALARPGGGHSYSGGGDGGGGGGGGGGGELAFFLIRIWFNVVIRYPAFGVPATVVIVVVFVVARKRHRNVAVTLDLGSPSVPTLPRATSLEPILDVDPNFSPVLFEDFVYALYARTHEARGDDKAMEAMAPYLSDDARRSLARRPPGGKFAAVIIGALRVVRVSIPSAGASHAEEVDDRVRAAARSLATGSRFQKAVIKPPTVAAEVDTAPAAEPPPKPRLKVVIEIESNMRVDLGGAQRTLFVKERWNLGRDEGVRSKPPQEVREFGCPSCGAPFESTADDRCAFCGKVVGHGHFDWFVERISLASQEDRPPSLTGTVPERGTDRPNVVQPGLAERRARLLADDPELDLEVLGKRVALIFSELNQAWTSMELKSARPFVSDGLFDYLQYWIGAYRERGLRNVLEDFALGRWEIVKIVRDSYFDAITLRIWASGRDTTVDEKTGHLLGGDPKRPRRYSEYWTLIRSSAARGAPRDDRTCPNCGAELEVTMAGNCDFCGARLSRGQFDWVLSKIEQDESYAG